MDDDHAAARRRPAVRLAGPAPELSGLDLDQLRAYRAALGAEEDKTSYWRRLVHGRVDLLLAQGRADDTLDLADLVRVLGDTGTGRSRRALMRVPAPVELPDLPDLEQLVQLWAAHPQGPDEAARLVEQLRIHEGRLSDYRRALHERLDAATAELIVRYRADPSACLVLLPGE